MSPAAAPRLALPEVTLLCVDTRTPELAQAAMRRCMADIDFGAAVLFTDAARASQPEPGIALQPLQLDSVAAYSDFMLRGLAGHVHTSHVLVVQWDGHVLDAGCWDPAFLQYDYIGAPLRDQPPGCEVGNGGFSLRSRRLLLALQGMALSQPHPEDLCICRVHRDELVREHGIRFAPLALARRFAVERIPVEEPTFGFHGLFNMHRVLSPADLHALVEALPDGLARGLDAHDLCNTLIRQGRLDTARLLLDKRRRLGMNDRRTWRLRARWWWRRWMG